MASTANLRKSFTEKMARIGLNGKELRKRWPLSGRKLTFFVKLVQFGLSRIPARKFVNPGY